MKRLTALGLCLIAGLALALAAPTLDPPPGSFIGQRKAVRTPLPTESISVVGDTLIKLPAPVTLGIGEVLPLVWDGTHWVPIGTKTGYSFTYQFPALGNTALAVPCAETTGKTISAPGVQITDQCTLATNLGADGGAALAETATLSCRAGTDVIVGKLCVQLTDAGTYTPGDAGYTARVTR